MELGVADAVAAGVVAGTRDECAVAFDPDAALSAARQGQREVAESAVKVKHRRVRRQLKQLHGAADERLVHRGIDLDEVGRREFQLEPETRQPVAQWRSAAGERLHRVKPAWLQVQLHAVRERERLEGGTILRRRGSEDPQHQRGGIIGHRHFDLRQVLADAQARQHRRERRDQSPGRSRQHLAGGELRHVGGGALTKPDHDAVLLVHELGTQAGAAPIAEGRSAERRQPAARLHAGHPRERLPQFGFFGGELCWRGQVLQRAAAAQAKVRAARHDAQRRSLKHLKKLPVIVPAVPARAPEADLFPRQRAGDEGGLAGVHHALALVGQSAHRRRLGRRTAPGRAARGAAQAGACQVLRNCAKCGSWEAAR
jgi:hypothetical protein